MKIINETLSDIIRICLSIDARAHATYVKFATKCSDESLAEIWRQCAKDEKTHVVFWKKALALSLRGELPEIFEDSEEVKSALQQIDRKVDRLLANFDNYDNPADTLAVAYRLESFMLDDSLMMMFRFFDAGNSGIEAGYEGHLDRFIQSLQKYAETSPQLDALAESLTTLYRRNRKLSRQTFIDPLTGLLNRRGFFNSVRPFTSLAERKKLRVAIIMGDIDNFKKINDTFGHQTGDKVIAAVASAISGGIRRSDIAGRYGGEEFIIFMSIDNVDSLKIVSERIRQTVEKQSERMAGAKATISLGGAVGMIATDEERDLSLLIALADENLLEAKKRGKNCCVYFEREEI